LKWNEIYQLLVCTDDINLMGKNIHTAKEEGGGGCKKGDLEIYAAETKYVGHFKSSALCIFSL
jgi:hypothetical protein